MRSPRAQLVLQSLGFISGFIIWVLLAALLPFIKEDIPLTAAQATWVAAIPVILGSVMRIPLGYLTSLYGARLVFMGSFLFSVLPIWILARAGSFFELVLGGFFLGVAGAVFAIGVTSLPRYFPPSQQGLANGIYGMGNVGTAITTFFAPMLAVHWGWRTTILSTLSLVALMVLAFIFLGDAREARSPMSLAEGFKALYRRALLWLYSLFYFVTFGSFVAFTVYLTNFLVGEYGLDKVDAGWRTAGFIALATLARPIGGWLSDLRNPYVVLSFSFGGLALAGVLLSFAQEIILFSAGALLVAAAAGLGNGAVFKLVPHSFKGPYLGLVNGVVGMFGGLGGFFPPLVLTYVKLLTGQYAIGFMALSVFAVANFVLTLWLWFGTRALVEEEKVT